VPTDFLQALAEQTEALKAEGLYKQERLITGPQQAAIEVRKNGDTAEVLNLCVWDWRITRIS
jgi:glycine C-acetyltransferase